jgi:hypothetical protein
MRMFGYRGLRRAIWQRPQPLCHLDLRRREPDVPQVTASQLADLVVLCFRSGTRVIGGMRTSQRASRNRRCGNPTNCERDVNVSSVLPSSLDQVAWTRRDWLRRVLRGFWPCRGCALRLYAEIRNVYLNRRVGAGNRGGHRSQQRLNLAAVLHSDSNRS